MTRDEALSILHEFTKSESLRKHALAVEACVVAYARKFGEDEQTWSTTALLHDFDYEIHPTLDQHPQDGVPILQERGYPDWAIEAVLSHADHLDIPRDTEMKKTLYAVDELTGFISAVAFVRPSKAVADVTPQAVRKKMKDKAFARAVDRAAMLEGAELLGLDFDEHVQFVILAMSDNAGTLGLAGVPVEPDAR
jgi:putative nucleotidyltransferase with HDIG domain